MILNNLLINENQIRIFKSREADIQWVHQIEHLEENGQYVFLWTINEHIQSLDNPNILHLIIKNNQDENVGYIIIDDLLNEHNSINLRRIVINEKNSGMGYKVLKLIIPYIFKHYNCHRLWLDVFTDNPCAIALYQKIGFKVEGILRDSYIKNDYYKSQIIMSILHNECEQLFNSTLEQMGSL